MELIRKPIDIGNRPVVLARTREQFMGFCQAFNLNPRLVIQADHPRRLEGLRPTAIIRLPYWFTGPGEVLQAAEVAERSAVKMRNVPDVNILEHEL